MQWRGRGGRKRVQKKWLCMKLEEAGEEDEETSR